MQQSERPLGIGAQLCRRWAGWVRCVEDGRALRTCRGCSVPVGYPRSASPALVPVLMRKYIFWWHQPSAGRASACLQGRQVGDAKRVMLASVHHHELPTPGGGADLHAATLSVHGGCGHAFGRGADEAGRRAAACRRLMRQRPVCCDAVVAPTPSPVV